MSGETRLVRLLLALPAAFTLLVLAACAAWVGASVVAAVLLLREVW